MLKKTRFSHIGHYNWYCVKCWKKGKVQTFKASDPRKIDMQALHTNACPAKGTPADLRFVAI